MEQNTTLNFENFITVNHPEYVIDSDNIDLIREISLWALRDKSFEDQKRGLYLDKGILLIGTVGSGKTDLFNLLRKYITYLRSSYQFSYGVVWKFTSDFSKDGYEAFEGQENGNRYYDELCMTDTRSRFPNKEMGTHYGQKILIGEELIMFRYNSFKRLGYQTHFSTNATPGELSDIYGERAFSRLNEMCNFLTLNGDDRRLSGNPNIYKNINQPAPRPKQEPNPMDELSCKWMIENSYIIFLQDGEPMIPYSLLYNMLYSVNIFPNDQEKVGNKQQAAKEYVQEFSNKLRSESEIIKDREMSIEAGSRVIFVKKLFSRLKEQGAKSVFGMREVDMENLIAKTLNPQTSGKANE